MLVGRKMEKDEIRTGAEVLTVFTISWWVFFFLLPGLLIDIE